MPENADSVHVVHNDNTVFQTEDQRLFEDIRSKHLNTHKKDNTGKNSY